MWNHCIKSYQLLPSSLNQNFLCYNCVVWCKTTERSSLDCNIAGTTVKDSLQYLTAKDALPSVAFLQSTNYLKHPYYVGLWLAIISHMHPHIIFFINLSGSFYNQITRLSWFILVFNTIELWLDLNRIMDFLFSIMHGYFKMFDVFMSCFSGTSIYGYLLICVNRDEARKYCLRGL